MIAPSRVILISGPPGAGKSALARALADTAETPTACIEGDKFWFFITKTRYGKQQNHRLVVKSMMLAAIPYARGGYDVIVDFTIGPWAFDLFGKWFADIPFACVILCPSEAVCAARAAGRAEGPIKDYAEYRDLHAAFQSLGAFERYAIRNDEADPAALAAHLRTAIAMDAYTLDLPLTPAQSAAPPRRVPRHPNPMDD